LRARWDLAWPVDATYLAVFDTARSVIKAQACAPCPLFAAARNWRATLGAGAWDGGLVAWCVDELLALLLDELPEPLPDPQPASTRAIREKATRRRIGLLRDFPRRHRYWRGMLAM
jgi:hypothetical protein